MNYLYLKNTLINYLYINIRTGLLYDPLMLDYHCIYDENYPEKPDRIKVPYERCQFYGLTDKCINIPVKLKPLLIQLL